METMSKRGKIILISVLLAVLLIYISFPQIIATMMYVQANSILQDYEYANVVPTEYTLSPGNHEAVEMVEVGGIKIPQLFSADFTRTGDSYYVASSSPKYFVVFYDESELPGHLLDDCVELKQNNFGELCESEFSIYNAVFSVSKQSASLFSDTKTKIRFSIISILKPVFGHADKKFTTSVASGFIGSFREPAMTTVYLFTNNGYMHHISFVGHSQSEIDFVLANIEEI